MKIFISPPFGNHIHFKDDNIISIEGSFTYERRPGLIWNALKTIRPYKGGWRNKIGLRNKGIRQINIDSGWNSAVIYSLAAIRPNDWDGMYYTVPPFCNVELNISCPNADDAEAPIQDSTLCKYLEKWPNLHVKVAPTQEAVQGTARWIEEFGLKNLHIGNTLPLTNNGTGVTIGGMSGPPLKPYTLKAVEFARRIYPDINIIGGGGIRTLDDVKEFQNRGANDISVSTIFFNPLKAKKFFWQIRT